MCKFDGIMNLFDLTITDPKEIHLENVFLSEENTKILTQVLKEHRYVDALKEYNLEVDHKILMHGASGCGKTMTAKAIATTLGKPIVIVDLSTLISSRIGETSKNLKALFDRAIRDKAVLFLDEFDQISKMRGNDDKDVGEMRRLVNTLLQLFDYFPSDSLLICATNHPEIIDTAILRRFQLRLSFKKPTSEQLDTYYNELLKPFPVHLQGIDRKYSLSYAEVRDYINTTMKAKLIEELEKQEAVNL